MDYYPCAGGLSKVNTIGTQLRGLISSGITRRHLTAQMAHRRGKREEGGARGCASDSAWPSPSRETKFSGVKREQGKLELFPVELITIRRDWLMPSLRYRTTYVMTNNKISFDLDTSMPREDGTIW